AWTAERGRLRRGGFLPTIDRVLRLVDKDRPDESLAAFLARRPGGPALAQARVATGEFVRGFHAADLERISAHALAPPPGEQSTGAASRSSRILGPQDALPGQLARELGARIRLGHVVTGIRWMKGRALVHVRSGRAPRRFVARAVVLTLPIGVARARPDARGAIVFEPDPPRIRRAIDHLAMGSVTKVDFAFEELPWTRFAPARYREERAGVGFLRTPGSAFNVWW